MGTFGAKKGDGGGGSRRFDSKQLAVVGAGARPESAAVGAVVAEFCRSQSFRLGESPAWAHFSLLYLNPVSWCSSRSPKLGEEVNSSRLYRRRSVASLCGADQQAA